MNQKNQFSGPIWPFRNTSIKTVAYLMHHLACHQWWKFQTKFKHWAIPEKSKQWVIGYTFLKTPVEILDLSLYPKKFQKKNKLSLLEILQNCATPLGNSKVKIKDPWKLHDFFLYTPGNSTSFLIDPWNFQMFFLQYRWKLHVLNPCPCLDIFWNSPFSGVLANILPKSSLKCRFLLVQKHLKI